MLCLPFWKNFFTPTLAVFLLVANWRRASVCGAAAGSSCVRVGGNHLTLRRGLLFPVTRRIPLRFLAGCHIVQTPLQRMTGTCLFFLYSSGCTTLVPGMRQGGRGVPFRQADARGEAAVNRQRRFHIIFAVHYLRYGLLLCLVPMLQALLAFDLDSLWAALRQDAVILLAALLRRWLFGVPQPSGWRTAP